MSADLSIEKQYSNYVIAGIDEVGRGAFAGPVVVAAVIINQSADYQGIEDSKSLSVKKRQELSARIKKDHVCAIGSATSEEIDALGINSAICLASERALKTLSLKPTLVLFDGNYKFELSIEKHNIISGDKKSISIAAASIVAKQYRDDLMIGLARENPQYGWDRNVGYGTKEHLGALAKCGITKYHRRCYSPIKDIILKQL